MVRWPARLPNCSEKLRRCRDIAYIECDVIKVIAHQHRGAGANIADPIL